MLKYRSVCYIKVAKFIELISYLFAFFAALEISWPKTFFSFINGGINSFRFFVYITISLIGLYIISSFFLNPKENYARPSLKDNILFITIKSFTVCIFLSLPTAWYFRTLPFSFFLLFLIITPTFYTLLQTFYNLITHYLNNRLGSKIRVLIIGTNKRAIQLQKYLSNQSLLGYEVIGFIDDENVIESSHVILGAFKDLRRIIREQVVDFLIICLPVRSFYDKISECIEIAQEQGVSVYCLSNFFEPKSSSVTIENLGSVSSLYFDSSHMENWKMLIKRIFDITVSFILIIITSPIMLFTAIGIVVQDGRPFLFNQRRIGYHKRIFTIYKFRSMYRDAIKRHADLEDLNEMDGPVFKIKKDPRIFSFGHFIRKYSIDELPQLFNILKGDMSIVGPRPLAIRDYQGFDKDWLRRRFSVYPGLTCYWQSEYNRNDISFEEWMHLDMKYIDKWSFLVDLKICFKTIKIVISGQGM